MSIAKAALSYAVGNSNKIQLLPAHNFRAKDGRPTNTKHWVINSEVAAKLINQISRQQDKLLIDYEHQTLYTRENGKQSPAAGWIESLEWIEGLGLFGVGVEWTDRAKQHIKNNEYRYISPVFSYDKITGKITSILHAALVNTPAIDGMAPVQDLQALKGELDINSLSMEELGVCQLFGISEQDYKKVKQQDNVDSNTGNINCDAEVCRLLGIN